MKIGDYVRTKRGLICRIININEFREPCMKYGIETSYLKDIMFIGDEGVLKSSPNIIDLIEVGDYVNGHKVVKKNKCTLYIEDYIDEDSYLYISRDNIKSIVTKEQFERMEYKVVE